MSSFTNLHPDVAASILTADSVAALANETDPQEGDIRYVKDVDTLYTYDGAAWNASAGGGGVNGPVSSTNNAVALWSGTGGDTLKNSVTVIDPATGATTGISINADGAGNSISNIENGDIKAGAAIDATKIADGTVTNAEFQYIGGLTSDAQTQLSTNATAISDHISDATDAHDATAISNVPSGNLAATDVQGALNELQSDVDTRAMATALSDHINDATDAHDASAISNSPSGNLAATDVQGALNELQSDVDTRATSTALTDHINDATAAHAGSAVSNTPSGNLAATDVQGALNELQTDVDTRATSTDLTNHISDTTTHGTTGNIVGTTDIQALTNKDIDGGTASNTSRLTLPKDTKANLDALTRKEATLVFASDQDKVYVDNGSVLTEVGSNATGTGEKNYVTNPSAASAITGWTAVNDLVVARTTTAAELPREYTTATGIKITADADTQSVADYVYYDFTLDDVDLNKKLKIQWSQKQTGTYVAGDLAVVITTQADRTTAIATPDVTAIPAYDGVFTASFDTASTATLSLVIRATTDMATNGGIVISDVIVGPGQIVNAAPIGPWTAFTPVLTSSGGSITLNATSKQDPGGFYRRVGDSAEIQINFKNGTGGAASGSAGNVRLTLPTGLTANTAAMIENSNLGRAVGSFNLYNGTTFDDQNIVVFNSGFFNIVESGTSDFLTLADLVAGYGGTILATVPIAEWAGAPNYAGTNDVEYAYNTGTWDATDTTSFGYGPGGQILGGALTGSNEKRVRFSTPIQATDRIELQLSTDRVSWYPAAGGTIDDVIITPMINSAGSASSGVWVRNVSGSTTDMDIFWGRYIQMENDDGGATNWPSSGYWRVMKARAGAAVGFGAGTSTSMGLVKAMPNTSFTVALTGPITSSATFRASRVGDVVTITWPQAFATGVSSATNITLNFTDMPSWARPAVNSFNPVFVRDNGTDQSVMGTVFFPTSSNGYVSRTYLNQFTSNTGSTGFEGGSASYVGSAW